LEILGRRDGQVKLRGHRIELGEVQAAVAGCVGVRQAVVVLAEAAVPFLAAFVTLDPGHGGAGAGGPEGGRDWAGELAWRLPAQMIPRRVTVLDALPLTRNGKVDRAVLARWRYADEQPDPDASAPAQGMLEELIATVWVEVLNLDRIARADNFFTLGGDSLTATGTVAAIARHTGVTLTLRDVYRYATVAELADLVRQRLAAAADLVMEEGVL
jgi:acyl carrier protein